MKKITTKKRGVKNIVILGIVLVLGLFLSFASFRIPFTVYNYNGFMNSIKLGIDLEGGVLAVYDVLPVEGDIGDFDSQVDATVVRIQDLLTENGYTEATIVKEGDGVSDTKIRVEVPDVDSPDEILDLIGTPATLEIKKTEGVEAEAELTGKHIKDVYTAYQENEYGVMIEFTNEGADIFADLTAELQPSTGSLYIYIDGELFSSPTVQSVIADGTTFISGSMSSQAEADAFATKILSGTFNVDLQLNSNEKVSATLGEDAIVLGIIAMAVALVLIFAFMIAIYRGFGIVSSISLLFYVVLTLFFLQAVPFVQLTLPGIAGIILSLGMAVDANVIIFERIKEEYRSGKKLKASVQTGFKRSYAAVIDGNVTTLLASAVLFIFGTGPIKGFATTLGLGVLVGVFCSLIISKALCSSFAAIKGEEKDAAFYGLKKEAK